MCLIVTNDPVLSMGGKVHRYHRFIQWLQVFVQLFSYVVRQGSYNLLKSVSKMWKQAFSNFWSLKKLGLGSIWNSPYLVLILPKSKWSLHGPVVERPKQGQLWRYNLHIISVCKTNWLGVSNGNISDKSDSVLLVYNVSILIEIWHHSKMRIYCIYILL